MLTSKDEKIAGTSEKDRCAVILSEAVEWADPYIGDDDSPIKLFFMSVAGAKHFNIDF